MLTCRRESSGYCCVYRRVRTSSETYVWLNTKGHPSLSHCVLMAQCTDGRLWVPSLLYRAIGLWNKKKGLFITSRQGIYNDGEERGASPPSDGSMIDECVRVCTVISRWDGGLPLCVVGHRWVDGDHGSWGVQQRQADVPGQDRSMDTENVGRLGETHQTLQFVSRKGLTLNCILCVVWNKAKSLLSARLHTWSMWNGFIFCDSHGHILCMKYKAFVCSVWAFQALLN